MSSLAEERYVSIETVRKNGTKAATPVWIAPLDGKLVFTTNDDTWKVKRIRRNAAVRLAPCDARGDDVGTYVQGTARIIEEPEYAARIQDAIKAKYTWQTWPFAILGFFQSAGRVGVEITLD